LLANSASGGLRRGVGVNRSRYEKGDWVWVLSGRGLRLPGAVIGYYVDWDLYRIVYMVDIMERDQRVVEKWRLTLRKKGEKHYIPK
jgi:hypothetical protein